ncbi:GTPase Gem1 [Schizosaccharomyces japonicus yFS275]|uniref:Mitochondrial Rho GTPase n=1 Tax=Schizosaccharomyces japonicus (strain yFS275 / FY16936) TaxID=402676 RepID=B6JZA2_SCHJY|nr:GTPase Gem1 [Schizosaccharomyces japonicus yFS275]EEB06870.1 GTPase Gem1 [Schizosaccharomyces japonicus yFS275]
MREVRIVVCGDQGVGKSSLIAALVQEDNVTSIPKVFPVISIPSDPIVNDDVSLVIVDTQSDAAERELLETAIKKAHTICLVYSDNYTYERISIFWLPYFRSLGVNVPVVLCANKSEDIDNNQGLQLINHEMVPLMNEYKEIEACIRCSAAERINVNELFYVCRSCVVTPITPLWETKEHRIKCAARDALSRIFFLLDKNNDSLVGVDELNELQNLCCSKMFTPDESKDIFDCVRAICPEGILGDSLNINGFLAYVSHMIENGKQESIWGILRAFHYTDSLSLDEGYLYPLLDVSSGQSVELSPKGYRFLVDLFYRFDRDNDGALNTKELAALFRFTPGLPETWIQSQFPNSTALNEHGCVTYNGWLAQWTMMTLFDYKTTLAYFAYLGFDSGTRQSVLEAIKVTKSRSLRNRRQIKVDRNVFLCLVVGQRGCGKTSLLSSFINSDYRGSLTPPPSTVVNSVEFQSKQRYLVLSEVQDTDYDVFSDVRTLDACDVLCLLYDSSNPSSFSYIANILESYPLLNKIPCVIAATKADLDRQQQRYTIQPDEYAKRRGLSSPTHISTAAAWNAPKEFFIQLAEAAQHPASAMPNSTETEENNNRFRMITALTAFGTLVLTVSGSLIWRIMKQRGSSSNR